MGVDNFWGVVHRKNVDNVDKQKIEQRFCAICKVNHNDFFMLSTEKPIIWKKRQQIDEKRKKEQKCGKNGQWKSWEEEKKSGEYYKSLIFCE